MIKNKKEMTLLAIFCTFATLMVFFGTVGLALAGDLEPPASAMDGAGDPVSTMKTLDEILPAWSRRLPADDGDAFGCNSSRFKCVWGGAILDLETGLVWEKIPMIRTDLTWYDAQAWCNFRMVNGRNGWQLPTVQQLSSLRDAGSTDANALPLGHPFTNINQGEYWTTTTYPSVSNANSAMTVDFTQGSGVPVGGELKTNQLSHLCVRGGMNNNNEF